MWKPGQIVTITGKRYRIKKCFANTFWVCHVCGTGTLDHLLHEPCTTCRSSKMPGNCYPQEIKPKSVMG